MNTLILNICLLMNALSTDAVEKVKETSRSLRKEGFKIPSMNHNVLVLHGSAPFRSLSEMVSPAWIRASFMKHNAIEWVSAMRTRCSCGAWFAKGEVICRSCNGRLWNTGQGASLRDGESKAYEQGIKGGISCLRLIPFVRANWGALDWRDARFGITQPRLRKGNLRNGSNDKVWMMPLGRSAHKVARALERLGLTEEAETYRAMPRDAQVWRQVVFVDAVHSWNNDELIDFAVDVAFVPQLEEAGLRYRSQPIA